MSLTPQRKRQHSHGLRMQTLPTSPEVKDSQGLTTSLDDEREEREHSDYTREKRHQLSSFEADEDFKFKRHKRKNTGAPTLGERLDNLQELQRARWMDNFNSSVNDRHSLSQPQLNPMNSPQRMMPPMPPYMPYMYYYPMPQMLPMPASPSHPQQQVEQSSQFMNSSQGYPNTSTQPFYPPPPSQNAPVPSGQLMPPPPLYPDYASYNFYANSSNNLENSKRIKSTREKRKSLIQQRGRRISMLSLQDEENFNTSHIVSPHKDVPEKDFYRHIANTSFGHGLQVRQLFNWCLIRCLRKRETQERRSEGREESDAYIEPTRIATVILKEFVGDLRKGNLEFDWEGINIPEEREEDNGSELDGYSEEDTELRELFDDDTLHKRPTNTRKRHGKSILKIPNEKNLQNSKNLIMLQEKISAIRTEIDQWRKELDQSDPQPEWSKLKQRVADTDIPNPINKEPRLEEIKKKATMKMDSFHEMSHLLNSHSKLLVQTTEKKLEKMSRCIITSTSTKADDSARKASTKQLLRGLSKALTK